MNLSATPPNAEVTEADIIKFQAGQLQAAAARIQELEIGLGTVTNIAACALKVLADAGMGDGPDEFRFSRDLSDRMQGTNLTLREEFGGAIVVHFRERSRPMVALETT